MIEVINKGDVVVVRLEGDVGVDVLEGADGRIHFRQASLVRLEK